LDEPATAHRAARLPSTTSSGRPARPAQPAEDVLRSSMVPSSNERSTSPRVFRATRAVTRAVIVRFRMTSGEVVLVLLVTEKAQVGRSPNGGRPLAPPRPSPPSHGRDQPLGANSLVTAAAGSTTAVGEATPGCPGSRATDPASKRWSAKMPSAGPPVCSVSASRGPQRIGGIVAAVHVGEGGPLLLEDAHTV